MSAQPAWYTADDCDIDEFRALVEQDVDPADYPHATRVAKGVVIFDSAALRDQLEEPRERQSILAELVDVLGPGPGVLVFQGAFDDETVGEATKAFRAIIEQEKASGTAAGDHFAAAGTNDRVWNALEKLAIAEPGIFARYYSNDMLALVSQAWLGPRYQVTSQLNQVNPGGQAQSPHRDYHLGFQSLSSAQEYPAHAHHLSPVLTLQGAVAHCDMPLETGPTYLLPHSHKYGPGYLAWHLPEFRAYAQEKSVQIPLALGDAVFFNPALFHGAGENTSTDVQRLGNLLQVSSAFGRAMEVVNRKGMVEALYPELLAWKEAGATDDHLRNAIAASAEGYPFPLDLDVHQPSGSEPPKAHSDLVWQAIQEGWAPEVLAKQLW